MSEEEAGTLQGSEKMAYIWNEYKNQNEWQRHNESQRAALSNILLAITGALVALLPRDPSIPKDWLTPASLIVIGIFGILAVMKYWERFMYHVQLEAAYRKVLDSYFAQDSTEFGNEDWRPGEKNLFIKTRDAAIRKHESGTFPLLKDRYVMQHWLWEVIFALIALLGVVLLIRVHP